LLNEYAISSDNKRTTENFLSLIFILNIPILKIDLYWDLRATIPERHTGVGKHVIEVINGLLNRPDVHLRVLLARDQAALWSAQSKVHGWDSITSISLPLTNKGNRFLYGTTKVFSLDKICAGRDIVYSPMELLLGLKRIPFVNTIHGIPYFESTVSERVYKSTRYRFERMKQAWFFRRCHRLCAHTFVVSDYLKDRLYKTFGFADSKLYPVYNGAESLFFSQPSNSFSGARQSRARLLTVGGANVFDGASNILKVAKLLQREMPQASIWIAGDRHELPWERRLRSQPNVYWLGFLSSERLAEEMQHATALLYVPIVESFGIIGVEAMAIGLPILATRSTALPEVLGDAAEWVDPEDSEATLQSLRKVFSDEVARKQLIEAGREKAQAYQWPKVVDRVHEQLKSVSLQM
jgi:glycosyltransferase involved in cell wall biosynthesis